MIKILSICDKSYIVQLLLIVKIFFKLACYIIPAVIIIITTIYFFKSLKSGKEEDLKANGKGMVHRIIAGLVVLFLPTIISFVFNHLIDGQNIDFIACMESASKEKVDSLKAKEAAEEEAEKKSQEKEDEILLRENYENDQNKKAKQKILFEEEQKRREERNNNTQPITGNIGVEGNDYKSKLSNMTTPTINEIQNAANSIGISNDYLIIVIGTTQREGYTNDPYLYYGWASAMINNKVSLEQMQGWDPYHSGEDNYYSKKNIQNGYNSASAEVLKSVYLALTERNNKIVECNGMYSETPSSYNLLYSSQLYNCSIYEKK